MHGPGVTRIVGILCNEPAKGLVTGIRYGWKISAGRDHLAVVADLNCAAASQLVWRLQQPIRISLQHIPYYEMPARDRDALIKEADASFCKLWENYRDTFDELTVKNLTRRTCYGVTLRSYGWSSIKHASLIRIAPE